MQTQIIDRSIRCATVLAALLLLIPCGCAPDLSKTESNPTIAANSDSSPLPLDPTDPVAIEGWWSNGRQLLNLADDGGYRLWKSNNRFDPPLQTGRWSRQNYLTLYLEPYATRAPERTRCELESAGSEVRLVIPGVVPMVRFETAPPAIEDQLCGWWVGPGGTLLLSADGRYRADASSQSAASAPVTLAGHGGRWIVEASNLLLIPDSPIVPPVVLAVEPLGVSALRLRAGDGEYLRTRAP